MNEKENAPCSALINRLTEGQQSAALAGLWRLTARRAALYTMDDSASVPEGVARELPASVTYTVEQVWAGEDPCFTDWEEQLCRGQAILTEKTETARQLWKTACLTAPKLGHMALEGTLKGIGGFFKDYDIRFFAHQIPCDIDYQLCLPVPEEERGVDYITGYLRRIIWENRLLYGFSRERTAALLAGETPAFRELLVNCCEPVLVQEMGLTLCGRSPYSLSVTKAERKNIADRLSPLSAAERGRMLGTAAMTLCDTLNIREEEPRRYFLKTAFSLIPRLSAALTAGDLQEIWPTVTGL